MLENILVVDKESGEKGYISRVIGPNLFEVELYNEKKSIKWYKVDEQGKTWDYA